ncbi:uncharacterized protein Rv2082-like [Thrips palmi]|uniref:Uncharacterized protein Rv2082-like n=1 Tax=Thrips palmi TaxID=161013 RepID=A0A6P8ZTK5_THRPL|nr:uncharacterized protein Rv2082-like [Thrips palmi]
MTKVVLRDGAMVLTAVCPKCRHEFPTQPPPTSPTSTPCPCDVGPTAAPIQGGGAAPAAWVPGQHSPVPPPAHSPSSAMLSLSITASSAASLNGGHVVVNTTPSAAPSSISVTATLPAGLPMWPWQSGQPGSTPTWAMMPTPAPPPTTTWPTPGLAMPAMSLPAWAAPPQPLPAWAMPAMPAAPLTLGLELFPRPQPQPACALKGVQYRLTGGGILHERGHGGPHPHDAPVLLQPQQHPRGKPGAPHACGPCGSFAPEQSPSTPLSFVLPGGALAPEAVAADSAGTPEADLRLLQATTQALKASGWYYEGFSWQESAATLRSAAPGTFLVRDSSDPRFLFSLSVQTDRGPTSVRLLYIAGGFRLDAEPHLAPTMPLFPCVLQLIEHYAENRGKRACPPCQPCQPPASQASALDGHQSRAGNRVQVWVDACGQVYSHILLTAPRRHTVPGLQHLARLAVHRQLKTAASSACPETPKARSERIKELELPTTLCRYLEEYPYTL